MNWEVLVLAIGMISTFFFSLVAYFRTVKHDKNSLAVEYGETGYKLVENLQADNAELRSRLTEAEASIATVRHEMQTQLDAVIAERDSLSFQLMKAKAQLIKQSEGSS